MSDSEEMGQTTEHLSPTDMDKNNLPNALKPLLDAFERLNPVAKVVAIAVTMMLGLAILSTVLKIVFSLIVVAVLACLGYVGYKFLLTADK